MSNDRPYPIFLANVLGVRVWIHGYFSPGLVTPLRLESSVCSSILLIAIGRRDIHVNLKGNFPVLYFKKC